MKKPLLIVSGALVLALAILALAFPTSAQTLYTKIAHASLIDSLINNTPIGSTTPSSGSFTLLNATGAITTTGGLASGLIFGDHAQFTNTVQANYLHSTQNVVADANVQANTMTILSNDGLSALHSFGGISSDARIHGATGDVTNNLYAGSLSIGANGIFSGSVSANSAAITSGITGNYATFLNTVQANYLHSTQNIVADANIQANTLTVNSTGVFGGSVSAPTFVGNVQGNVAGATGGFTSSLTAPNFYGNLNGNAGTASSLQNAPSNCTSNGYAYGVAANGTALCGQAAGSYGAVNTSGYQKLPNGLVLEWGLTGTFDTGPEQETFPIAFPHTVINVQVTANRDTTSAGRIWSAGGLTASGFQAWNDGLGGARWFAIGY